VTGSIILGIDRETLQEKVDLRAAADRLDDLENQRSLAAITEKVTLLRVVGRIDDAWTMANEAVRLARFTGDRETLLAARVRRAQVQHYQEKFEVALRELSGCVNEAHAHDWIELEVLALQARGRAYFDRRDYRRALVDFEEANGIRERNNLPAEPYDGTVVAIAVTRELLTGGSTPQRL
jgi:tetratricopeptide (TPR) repeat protein